MSGNLSNKAVKEMLKKCMDHDVSDVHLVSGKRPLMKIQGKPMVMKDLDVWTKADIEVFLGEEVLDVSKKWEKLKSGELDSSFSLGGQRFRMHAYYSLHGKTINLRSIPLKVPPFETLNLPDTILRMAEKEKGLFLVTGPTGSGKTTTIASMVDHINRRIDDNKIVVTVEDPVEFIFEDVNARITQREVGRHVYSFERATTAMMRQSPNVIMIGELRETETIRNAIKLAQTGHLVLASIHGNGAAEVFNRLIEAYEGDKQEQMAKQILDSLQGIVHQNLINIDGSEERLPLVEVLALDNKDLKKKLSTDPLNLSKLREVMSAGYHHLGMQDKVAASAKLVKDGKISFEKAEKITGVEENEIRKKYNHV